MKGSPFMMRVGTQRRSKSSNNSPNTTYRQSPTSNSRASPSSPYNATKSSNYTSYRPSPSPVLGETQKYAQDYHKKSVEKRLSASPSYERPLSPSYAPRSPSPTFAPRTESPSFLRTQSPDYITSKKLNDRRYLSASPNFTKKTDYDSSYANKMSSLRVSDNRSPAYMERSSPDANYTSSSRYEKHTRETRTHNDSYDDDGIDTSPIVKVSAMADRASARRDSWDAIAKTRNMLSHRSLESVANLTEAQLNAELQRKRAEEHENFVNHEQSYRSNNYTQSYSQKYSNNADYGTNERIYGTTQSYKNGIKAGGAAAVKVQPVPDGVLGQPVEFESKYIISNSLSFYIKCSIEDAKLEFPTEDFQENICIHTKLLSFHN